MITKILAIEDDESWIEIFKILIEYQTKDLFDYTYVKNLNDAVTEIKNYDAHYELILLDLLLPDSQAANTIKVIANESNSIPIVIMTTLDDESLMQTAYAFGVEDYLVKDQYDLETFLHVIKQAIKRFLGKHTNYLKSDLEIINLKLKLIDNKIEMLKII